MSANAHDKLHGYLLTHEDGAYVSVPTVLIARVKAEWERSQAEVAKLEASAEEDGASLNAQAGRIRELAKECLDLRAEVATLTSSRDHITATYKELCGRYTAERSAHDALRGILRLLGGAK